MRHHAAASPSTVVDAATSAGGAQRGASMSPLQLPALEIGSRSGSAIPPQLGGGTAASGAGRNPTTTVRMFVVPSQHKNDGSLRCANEIRTSKYTLLSFLPLFLTEQFRRLSNVYFLLILCVNMVPGASQNNPYSAIFPLSFVLGVAAIKDGLEDFKRHRSDEKANAVPVLRMRRTAVNETETDGDDTTPTTTTSGKKNGSAVMKERYFQMGPSRDVKVGDVLLVHHGEVLLADCILLNSSLPDGVAYIETANLDGESNAKTRRAPAALRERLGSPKQILEQPHSDNGHTEDDALPQLLCPPPSVQLYAFQGQALLPPRHLRPDSTSCGGSAVASPSHQQQQQQQEQQQQQQHNAPSPSRFLDVPPRRLGALVDSSAPTVRSPTPGPSNAPATASAMLDVVPLTVNAFLPRGCILRNTEWALCLVIYTGADTKMMMNLTFAPNKPSMMTRVLNNINVLLFTLQHVIIFISCGLAVYWNKELQEHWYIKFRLEEMEGAKLFFWRYLTFLVAYSSLIPISLYVSLEIVKGIQLGWIAKDRLLGVPLTSGAAADKGCNETHSSDAAKGGGSGAAAVVQDDDGAGEKKDDLKYARPKTSNVNVELSQVRYIFTDKTGTLTENAMTFAGGFVDGAAFDAIGGTVSLHTSGNFPSHPQTPTAANAPAFYQRVGSSGELDGAAGAGAGAPRTLAERMMGQLGINQGGGARRPRAFSNGGAYARPPPAASAVSFRTHGHDDDMATAAALAKSTSTGKLATFLSDSDTNGPPTSLLGGGRGRRLSVCVKQRLFTSLSKPQETFQSSSIFRYLLTMSLCHSVQPFPVLRPCTRQPLPNFTAAAKKSSVKGGGNPALANVADGGTPVTSPDTAPTEEVSDKVTYEGASLDEVALVEAAANEGFMLTHRTIHSITVELFRCVAVKFSIIAENEFTPERKRMSIILRKKDVKTFTNACLLRGKVRRSNKDNKKCGAQSAGNGTGATSPRNAWGDTTAGGERRASDGPRVQVPSHTIPTVRSTNMDNLATDPPLHCVGDADAAAVVGAHPSGGHSPRHHPHTLVPAVGLSDAAAFPSLKGAHTTTTRVSVSAAASDVPSASLGETNVSSNHSATEEVGVTAAPNHRHSFHRAVPSGGPDELDALLEDHDPTSDFIEHFQCLADTMEEDYLLLVKGADSAMTQVLNPSHPDNADHHRYPMQAAVDDMAGGGLRTLMMAYRQMSQADVDAWLPMYHEAQCCLGDRAAALEEAYAALERDLVLIGCTAVEDKLQDEVPQTIRFFVEAEIIVWMLTGDKRETAVTIAENCGLIGSDSMVVHVDFALTDAAVFRQGTTSPALHPGGGQFTNGSFLSETALGSPLNGVGGDSAFGGTDAVDDTWQQQQEGAEYTKELDAILETCQSYPHRVVLIIDGYSLQKVYDNPDLVTTFCSIAILCRSAVCCRMTPLQKADIVRLFQAPQPGAGTRITLAIGDGANDVSMIQQAHVGIGIMGVEGSQAELASDFAIPKFRHLKRLLVVHGRHALYRESVCMFYSIYKTILLCTVLFCYSFQNGFTGTMMIDSWLLSMYNLIFLSLPALILGAADKDVPDELAETHPQLYAPLSRAHTFLDYRARLRWTFDAISQGVLVYFVSTMVITNESIHKYLCMPLEAYGAFTFFIMVLLGNLQGFYAIRCANPVTLGGMWFNVLLLPAGSLVYSSFRMFAGSNGMYRVAEDVWASTSFWVSAGCVCIGFPALFLWGKGYWMDWSWPTENGPVAMRIAAVAFKAAEAVERRRRRTAAAAASAAAACGVVQ